MTEDQIEIRVMLYGAFRSYGNGRDLKLHLRRGTDLSGMRKALVTKLRELDPEFSNTSLVEDSAFADENAVLEPNFIAESNCVIAVLPPVCGG